MQIGFEPVTSSSTPCLNGGEDAIWAKGIGKYKHNRATPLPNATRISTRKNPIVRKPTL